MERNILDFLELHSSELRKLERSRNESFWKFTLMQARAQARRFHDKNQLRNANYSEREAYARVLTYDREGLTETPDAARQVRVLRLLITEHQISPTTRESLARSIDEITQDIADSDKEAEEAIGEETISPLDAQHILSTSTSDARRRGVWEMQRRRARVAAPTILRMVGQRNRSARDLGFRDYFQMALELDEIDETRLIETLNTIIAGTDSIYRKVKKTIDAEQSKLIGRSQRSLKPWHYSRVYLDRHQPRLPVDLDIFYKRKSLAKVARTAFSRMGIDVTGILEDSDIEVSDTKHPDPLVLHIDPAGSTVRVSLQSTRDGESGAELLSSFGKAIYLSNLGKDLPYLLRRPSHPFIHDAIGRVMGSLTRTPEFLVQVLSANKSTAGRLRAKLQGQESMRRLLELRFAATLIGFERALYREPGSDLNTTWWRLITRIQGLTPPGAMDGPDWASEPALIHNPVRAHRTLFAEMAACQIESSLKESLGVDSLVGQSGLGALLSDKLFTHGARLDWEEAVGSLTGKPLSVDSLLEACQPD
jgi:peptidyl-dipeptidase A